MNDKQRAMLDLVTGMADEAGYTCDVRLPRHENEGASVTIRGPRGIDETFGIAIYGWLNSAVMSPFYDRDFDRFLKRLHAAANRLRKSWNEPRHRASH